MEKALQGQLLALEAPDIAGIIVAKAQESLQLPPLKGLLTRLQVDHQALAVVHVVEPLRHGHLDAAHQVGQVP